jgi:hypothetical protein
MVGATSHFTASTHRPTHVVKGKPFASRSWRTSVPKLMAPPGRTPQNVAYQDMWGSTSPVSLLPVPSRTRARGANRQDFDAGGLGATDHAQERSAVDDQHGPQASVLSEGRPVDRLLDLRADTDGGGVALHAMARSASRSCAPIASKSRSAPLFSYYWHNSKVISDVENEIIICGTWIT